MIVNKDLKKRIIEIAYKNNMGHIGSSFACVDIINNIFKKIYNTSDLFILSNGHASLALYVTLEKYYKINANELFSKHGLHPHLDPKNYIFCSSGSLGQALTVAIGRAIGNPNRNIHCMISDGETYEGSFWESLSFIQDKKITNIIYHIISNGFGAYDKIDSNKLEGRLKGFHCNNNLFLYKNQNLSVEELGIDILTGLSAHYKTLNTEQYNKAINILS